MITYQEEQIENILGEMKPLLKLHWEELANNKDIRPLDVDYNRYSQLNAAGYIRVFTVRDEGVLVGYASFTVGPNLHYQSWKYAVSDVYYLNKAYRNKGIGPEMFSMIEAWLKSLEVKSITVQDKINHSHESFFKQMGYTPIEQLYEKVL